MFIIQLFNDMTVADSNVSDMIIHMHKSTFVHDFKGHREWNDMVLFFYSSDYISILSFRFCSMVHQHVFYTFAVIGIAIY
jgi:hypothetical protein